jgi:hypothetical protein
MAARRRASWAEFPLYTPPHKKSIDKAHKHWGVKFPDFVYFAILQFSGGCGIIIMSRGQGFSKLQGKVLSLSKKKFEKFSKTS